MDNYDTAINAFIAEMAKVRVMRPLDFMLEFSMRFYPEIERSFVIMFVELTNVDNANKFLVEQDEFSKYGLATDKKCYYAMKTELQNIGLAENVDWTGFGTGQTKTGRNQKVILTPKAFFTLLEHKKTKNAVAHNYSQQVRNLRNGGVYLLQYEILRQEKLNLEKTQQIDLLKRELHRAHVANCIIVQDNKRHRRYISFLEQQHKEIWEENRILNDNNKTLLDCVICEKDISRIFDIDDVPPAMNLARSAPDWSRRV